MTRVILTALTLAVFFLGGCTDLGDPAAAPGGDGGSDGIDFSSQILPIFQTSCIVCHSGVTLNGGLDLSSYTSVTAGTSNNGPVVVANDADNSYIIWALEGINGAIKMPQGGTLNQTNIGLIRQWIDEGALENAPSEGTNGGINN